jgi:hypothetical protein
MTKEAPSCQIEGQRHEWALTELKKNILQAYFKLFLQIHWHQSTSQALTKHTQLSSGLGTVRLKRQAPAQKY